MFVLTGNPEHSFLFVYAKKSKHGTRCRPMKLNSSEHGGPSFHSSVSELDVLASLGVWAILYFLKNMLLNKNLHSVHGAYFTLHPSQVAFSSSKLGSEVQTELFLTRFKGQDNTCRSANQCTQTHANKLTLTGESKAAEFFPSLRRAFLQSHWTISAQGSRAWPVKIKETLMK